MKFKIPKLLRLLLFFLVLTVILNYIRSQSDPALVAYKNFQTGEKLFLQKRYPEAIEVWEFERAQNQSYDLKTPVDAQVLVGLCLAYLEMDNYDMSQKRCQEAQHITDKVHGHTSRASKDLWWAINLLKDQGKGVKKSSQ